jgi:hypothetical protein
MVKQVENSAAMGKLKGLLKSRYGADLSIQWMRDVSSLDMSEQGMQVPWGDLHIPITVHDQFFATAVVKNLKPTAANESSAIRELVQMVLEPEFYNWHLGQIAANSFASEKSMDNVVSIFSNDIQYDLENDFIEIQEKGPSAIVLEASNPGKIPRVAHEIHELSGRWACLRFQDIQNQIKSVQDLKELGHMSILIEDLLQLSPDQQKFISDYIQSSIPDQNPLLLIGCSSEFDSLVERKMIEPALAQVLEENVLQVDRLPKSSDLLQETLEFILHL